MYPFDGGRSCDLIPCQVRNDSTERVRPWSRRRNVDRTIRSRKAPCQRELSNSGFDGLGCRRVIRGRGDGPYSERKSLAHFTKGNPDTVPVYYVITLSVVQEVKSSPDADPVITESSTFQTHESYASVCSQRTSYQSQYCYLHSRIKLH